MRMLAWMGDAKVNHTFYKHTHLTYIMSYVLRVLSTQFDFTCNFLPIEITQVNGNCLDSTCTETITHMGLPNDRHLVISCGAHKIMHGSSIYVGLKCLRVNMDANRLSTILSMCEEPKSRGNKGGQRKEGGQRGGGGGRGKGFMVWKKMENKERKK